jgi:hypothetical protein
MKNRTAPEAQAAKNQSNLKLVRPESQLDRLGQLQEAGSASKTNQKETENVFYREILALER